MSRFGPAGEIGRGPGPQRVSGEEAGIALASSSTIVGLHFQSIGALSVGFAGSAPIAGRVQLQGLWWQFNVASGNVDPHRIQMAVGSNVPTTQAELDAGEAMFPRASQVAESRFAFVFFRSDDSRFVPVGTVLALNGRRIVGGFFNGSGSTIDAYVGLVLQRIVGGVQSGDPPFLEGEEIAQR